MTRRPGLERSRHWHTFFRIWRNVALILLALVVLLWLFGYGPGGRHCTDVTTEAPVVDSASAESGKTNLIADFIAAERLVSPDRHPPLVRLNGPTRMTLPIGQAFDDPGAVAVDGIDGELDVVTSGQVVHALPGEYVMSYSARDAAGNVSRITRTVVVTDTADPADTAPDTVRLYFAVGSSAFPNDTRETLAPLMEKLRPNLDTIAVITGFHDASGDRDFNQELAKQRALAVGQLLQQLGIPARRIRYEKPAETTGDGPPEQARRVEVSVSAN